LAFYDYVGNSPAKGGLFRVGPMNQGDGIAQGWLGHPVFTDGEGRELSVRRLPNFFETFPVVLLIRTALSGLIFPSVGLSRSTALSRLVSPPPSMGVS
jgi:hypothetical protein